MVIKNLYLLLAVLGAVIPLASFAPWVREHGLDIPLLLREIAASRTSLFAWLDVVITVVVIVVFSAIESRRSHMPFPLLPIVACLLVGASCGLPLFLWFRERHLERAA